MFSQKDNYIIVNYHYVRDPSPEWSGIYPCAIEEFDRHVRFLSKNYKIISIPEVYKAARNQSEGKFCALTFDDGTKDQFQNALPILEKYGARATFFIITSTLDGCVPTAHKIHIMLSRESAEKLIDQLNEFLRRNYPDLAKKKIIPKDRRLTLRRMHEGVLSANLKEGLIMLPEDIRDQFFRGYFDNSDSEQEWSKRLFMNETEIKHLKKIGMTIGNHSYGHHSFDVITKDVLRQDIRLAQERLAFLVGERPKILSYPHGRSTLEARQILEKEGFQYAVTIERRSLQQDENNLLIPRYDAADLQVR